MEEQVRITVNIAGRSYSLKVNKSDAANVQVGAEFLNEKFQEMKMHFQSSDSQDHLAMSAIMNMTELLKKSSPDELLLKELSSKLESTNNELMKVMKG